MGKSIGIIAIKGGVGKTTISASLATHLADKYNKKVLLVDANYSAPNLGLHMDIINPEQTIHHVLSEQTKIRSAIHKKHGVDVIPGSLIYDKKMNLFKLKDRLKTIKNDYDFVIIDSSPSLNDEVLSTMLASDMLFVVSTPDYPTLSCSIKAAKLAKQRGKPIAGLILNKLRCPEYEINLQDMEEILDLPVLARIPDDKKNIRALFERKPLTLINKKTKFSKEIENLSTALTNSKENIGLFSKIFKNNLKKEQVNRELFRENLYSRMFKD